MRALIQSVTIMKTMKTMMVFILIDQTMLRQREAVV
jgi:hypothetical protein